MSSASVKLPQLGTDADCFPIRVMVMVMDVFGSAWEDALCVCPLMSSASVKLPQLGTGTDCFPVRVMDVLMLGPDSLKVCPPGW